MTRFLIKRIEQIDNLQKSEASTATKYFKASAFESGKKLSYRKIDKLFLRGVSLATFGGRHKN